MAVLGNAIELLASAAGAALLLFLLSAYLAKRRAGFADRIAAFALSAATLWFLARAVIHFHLIVVGPEDSAFVDAFAVAGRTGGGLAAAGLLYIAILWAGGPRWTGALALAAAVASIAYGPAAVASLGGAAGVSILAARQQDFGAYRRFHIAFAITLLVTVAMSVAGTNTARFAVAALLPVLCWAYFVYRYHLYGVLISRRIVFVLALTVVSAVYLFLVRNVAVFVEDRYDAFREVVEVALLLGVAVIWLPLYEAITRFLSRRTQVYAEFSQEVIEQAVRHLDVRARVQFLAAETGRLFAAERAWIRKASAPRCDGLYECTPDVDAAETVDLLLTAARKKPRERIHALTSEDPVERALLEKIGFNYAVPLWYEEKLTGILLLDTRPRYYLDEYEPILLGLSRQVSHSIEACRLVEEKISLEKALLRQEHLASLGRVAATIAHEVKNPLSSIKTLAQLMREDPEVTARYEKDLGFIVGETDRLNQFVMQLLTFSRPTAGDGSDVIAFELLESSGETLRLECASRRLRFQYNLDPALRDYQVDRQTLQQIVLNLLLNAIDASPENGRVWMNARVPEPGMALIEVVDEGPGIPSGIREKIFEPFFTTKQKGSGLGLAIVRKSLQLIDGELAVTSPVAGGRGTRVAASLPLKALPREAS